MAPSVLMAPKATTRVASTLSQPCVYVCGQWPHSNVESLFLCATSESFIAGVGIYISIYVIRFFPRVHPRCKVYSAMICSETHTKIFYADIITNMQTQKSKYRYPHYYY